MLEPKFRKNGNKINGFGHRSKEAIDNKRKDGYEDENPIGGRP